MISFCFFFNKSLVIIEAVRFCLVVSKKFLEEYGAGGMNMYIYWGQDDSEEFFKIEFNCRTCSETHEYSIFEFDEFMSQIYEYVEWRTDSLAPN